jgi:predicted nucleic acid-binding protein
LAKILLDSDVIIAWLRGREEFVGRIAQLFQEHSELFWTPVSMAEIFAGVRRGEEDAVSELFVLLETVPISASAGKKAGQYMKTYAKSHGVQLGDALTAACASVENLQLWTLNRRHYPMKDIRFLA